MVDRVGQRLGNYRLVRFLGHGGFADVYLGEHLCLGIQVAIKVLFTQLPEEDVERFLAEARTLASLEHPYIIRMLDFAVEQDIPFLVMSYAPNGTLRQRYLKGMRLPLDNILTYLKQAASALQCAHDARLIHRDIKPENMLLSRYDDMLLSDFGIAVVLKALEKDPHQRFASVQEFANAFEQACQGYLPVTMAMLPNPTSWQASARHIPEQESFYTSLTLPESKLLPSTHAKYGVSRRALLVGAIGMVGLATLSGSFGLWAFSQQRQIGSTLVTYMGHLSSVATVSWSPDGQLIASASNDGTVRVWQAS